MVWAEWIIEAKAEIPPSGTIVNRYSQKNNINQRSRRKAGFLVDKTPTKNPLASQNKSEKLRDFIIEIKFHPSI